MKKILVILLAALSVCSCDKYNLAGMFVGQGPDVNKRFANSQKLNEESPLPDIVLGSNEYKMFVVTDIHSTGDCPHLVKFVSSCLADTIVEHFVLCLGDVVTGLDTYKAVQRDIQPLVDAGWTFFATPGNHDVNFGQYREYQEMWPRSSYQFRVVTPSAGTDLFIVVDSADGKIGTDQRAWLEESLSKAQNEKYRNRYILTHTHFFKKDNSQSPTGNYALEETMDLTSLFARYGVNYVLCGHDHYYEYTKYRGVDYYVLNALSNTPGSFYRATFGDKLSLEEIKII